jgi:heparan-alpha-glucosaminide N-acetyltransferase
MPTPDTATPSSPPQRLTSLDAYRGFVMFLMMAEVLSFRRVAEKLPASGFWQFLSYHQSHVPWVGCSLHDLIQPSFSFIVGVALPFSIANRMARGQTQGWLSLHAFWRALVLVLLGVFLRSTGSDMTNWTFEDTLTQIGLGYGFLFLLGFRPARDQWIALAVILAGYWMLFALWPLPGSDFDWKSAGVASDWQYNLTGFAAHWNKNTNPAWAFDTRFMNLFPRLKPYTANAGGYVTLSFIPTLGTMILGLIAGGVLRSGRAPWVKVQWLALAGVIALAAADLIGWLGICPVVKRIWTPGWVLFSGGWCLILLAAGYAVIDLAGWKGWSFPLVVIGMNSIAAYCMAHLFEGFIHKNLATHLGANTFKLFGPAYEPLVHGAAVLLTLWIILLWMYRRKIFLRI